MYAYYLELETLMGKCLFATRIEIKMLFSWKIIYFSYLFGYALVWNDKF